MLVGPNYLVRKIDPPMFVFLCNAVILRKISKIGATRCQILRLKYTMLGLCPDPAGRVQWSPRPPTVFKGSTSKGREGPMKSVKPRACKVASPPLVFICDSFLLYSITT